MPEKPTKPRLLIRHGREPREDALFAQGLAELLGRVGFEVRLVDREDSTQQTLDSSHSLLLVSRSWLERAGSAVETDRLDGRTGLNHRLIAICRDSIDERLISAHLKGLPTIEWLPDDPEPEARLWEIYCGLSKTPPGDRLAWAASGRDLLGTSKVAPTPAHPAGLETTQSAACPSRPALVRPSKSGTFLLTDSGACYLIDPGVSPKIRRLPDLEGSSAVAVDEQSRLFIGLYNGMVATLLDDDWIYHPGDSAVLSLAATPIGMAIGEASGSVRFGYPDRPPIGAASLEEPIVELAPIDGGVVALGARGGLWRLELEESGRVQVVTVAPNESLGRPVGLFETGDRSTVGIFSSERVALLSRSARTPRVGIRRFPEGIGSVVAIGLVHEVQGRQGYGLLTDAGQVWTISPDLKTVSPAVLPDSQLGMIGLAAGPGGSLLAWSSGGSAFAIARDRPARSLAALDVVLAFAEPGWADRSSLVLWHPDRGLQLRRQTLEASR